MDTPNSAAPGRGYLIALTSTFLWATTTIFIGYLTRQLHTPPLVLAFWRNFFVVAALWMALTMIARPQLRMKQQHVLLCATHGLTLAALNALWMTSVALNGAAVAAVLIHSSPAFTALAGWRWWGERLGALKIGAVLLSIAGCALASGAYSPAAWQVNPLGILGGLATGALFAIYGILGKVSSDKGINPWTSTLYTFAFATVFLLLAQRADTLFWLSRPLTAGPAGWREAGLGWGLTALLAVGPTLGGYGLYTVGLAYLPTTTANLIATLEPAIAAVLAFFFLGERLTFPQILGGGLILTGVLLLRLSDRSIKAPRPQSP